MIQCDKLKNIANDEYFMCFMNGAAILLELNVTK